MSCWRWDLVVDKSIPYISVLAGDPIGSPYASVLAGDPMGNPYISVLAGDPMGSPYISILAGDPQPRVGCVDTDRRHSGSAAPTNSK